MSAFRPFLVEKYTLFTFFFFLKASMIYIPAHNKKTDIRQDFKRLDSNQKWFPLLWLSELAEKKRSCVKV